MQKNPDQITPSLSVVIPLYQKERHIAQCLTSAYASCKAAGVPFEIVVVDDGSTDGSADLARAWASDDAGRQQALVLITQENRGAAAARNTGWKAARGRAILFLDADDFWHMHHVQEIIDLMREFPEGSLYADAWSEIASNRTEREHLFGIGSESRGPLPCFFEAMSSGPMIVSSSTAGTWKHCLEKTGGFPEGVRAGEDKVGWGRLALLGDVVWSPRIGAVWDKSADNRSDIAGVAVPSPAFRDFLREAVSSAGISDLKRENIETALAVESARLEGRLRFYDHETPALFSRKKENPEMESV